MSGEKEMEMLEKWEKIKGLYETNKDYIVMTLCGILFLSWIL